MSQTVSSECELDATKNGSNKPNEDTGAGYSRRNIQMKIARRLHEDFENATTPEDRLKIATVIAKVLGRAPKQSGKPGLFK